MNTRLAPAALATNSAPLRPNLGSNRGALFGFFDPGGSVIYRTDPALSSGDLGTKSGSVGEQDLVATGTIVPHSGEYAIVVYAENEVFGGGPDANDPASQTASPPLPRRSRI